MPGESARINGKKGGRPVGSKSARTRARERAEAKALEQEEITAERTMLEIARIAFADRRQVWTDSGALKPFNEWSADDAALLEGFEVIVKNAQAGDGHTDTVHKVRLATKLPALEILAKHFGLFTNKLELHGKVTLEQLVVASFAKE